MKGAPRYDPATEVAKYDRLYREDPGYRMGANRMAAVRALLSENPGGSYLDVGAGRGEAMEMAKELGYTEISGSDAALGVSWDHGPALGIVCCFAWEQPFGDQDFETVSCFDTLEHLPPDKLAETIQELGRVCSRRLILSASSKPDVRDGVDLHISARPIAEWDAGIRLILGGEFAVAQRPDIQTGTSAVWECLRLDRQLGGKVE